MQNAISFSLTLIFGLILGGGVFWLFTRSRGSSETQWSDTFSRIANEALRQSHESFLQIAEGRLKQSEMAAAATLDKKSTAIDEMIKPVKETLGKMDAQIQALEIKREGAYQEVLKAVSESNKTQQQLRTDTGQLLQALRTPTTRGQWGEIQVRRILEMMGMMEHTSDFSSQHHVAGEDGNIRPDYVVRLPGNHCIVIDSKVPLTAVLDGAQSNDPDFKKGAMEKHAKQVREHIRALNSKAYWDKIDGSANFVVLFVPGDLLASALDCDPDLFEYGTKNNIVLASPTTLVALLHVVAINWQQDSLREHSKKLGALGGELYAALAVMTSYVSEMGSKIEGSIDCYNKMIGSLERNVLSKARRLRDLGAKKEGKDIPDALEPVDKQPRALQAPESEEKDDAA
jgi:DNA recombination protein RmuC